MTDTSTTAFVSIRFARYDSEDKARRTDFLANPEFLD
jgi:hypothetical protein